MIDISNDPVVNAICLLAVYGATTIIFHMVRGAVRLVIWIKDKSEEIK